jgi:proliferating cell nuclear antigen
MSVQISVQADVLQQALAPVEAIVAECKLQCTDDGLAVKAVDPANVAMCSMELDAGACATYRAGGETLGINLERFSDVVGMADDDQLVHLELDADRKLAIEFGGLSFTLALIDPESIRDEPDLPDLDLPATYVFEASEFGRGVSAADLVGDHVELVGADDELRVVAEGDTDDVTTTLSDDELLQAVHSGDGEVSSLFSLDYLEDLTAPLSKDDECSLQLGDEFPMRLKYSLGNGGDDPVSVEAMCAPRIQSN